MKTAKASTPKDRTRESDSAKAEPRKQEIASMKRLLSSLVDSKNPRDRGAARKLRVFKRAGELLLMRPTLPDVRKAARLAVDTAATWLPVFEDRERNCEHIKPRLLQGLRSTGQVGSSRTFSRDLVRAGVPQPAAMRLYGPASRPPIDGENVPENCCGRTLDPKPSAYGWRFSLRLISGATVRSSAAVSKWACVATVIMRQLPASILWAASEAAQTTLDAVNERILCPLG